MKPIWIILLLVATAAVYAAETPLCEAKRDGTCYYIDHNRGNDRNDGSFERPWRTFANINSYEDRNEPSSYVDLNPGDVVYVFDGTYSETVSYYGKRSVLRITGIDGTPSRWITLKAYPGEKPVITSNLGYDEGHAIVLDRSKYWNIEGLTLANNKHTALWVVESSHVNVRNMHIYNTDGKDNNNVAGLMLNSVDHAEISNNIFHDNYDRRNSDTGGKSTPNSMNMVIFRGGDVKIFDNEFYQSNPITAEKTGGCLKIKHAGHGPPFEISNNIFKNCKHMAIGIGTKNTYIHDNVIIDSSPAFWLQDHGGPTSLQDITIEHNTVYGQEAVVFLYPDNYEVPRNIIVRKNIFYTTLHDYTLDHNVHDIGTYDENSRFDTIKRAFRFEDNCYYNPYTNLRMSFMAGGESRGSFFDFSSWKSNLGYDMSSVYADPLFADVVRGDFGLRSGSPCQAKGAREPDQVSSRRENNREEEIVLLPRVNISVEVSSSSQEIVRVNSVPVNPVREIVAPSHPNQGLFVQIPQDSSKPTGVPVVQTVSGDRTIIDLSSSGSKHETEPKQEEKTTPFIVPFSPVVSIQQQRTSEVRQDPENEDRSIIILS